MRSKGEGSVFKPKGNSIWWVHYTSGGKRRYESSGSTRKGDANDLLKARLAEIGKGLVVTRATGKITLGAALRAVVDDLKMNGRTFAHTQRRIDKHILLTPASHDTPATGHFPAERRLNSITTSDLTAFAAERLQQGAARASVNHELAVIRRGFRLALRGGEVAAMPHIPMMSLNNARKGFLERAEFEAILGHLPAHMVPPLEFMFATGWRSGEVFGLTASQVDLANDVVRLEPGTTKNKDGRLLVVAGELRTILQAQLDAIDALKKAGTIVPFVFHYPDGRRIRDYRTSWVKAREAAGYPAALLHDFRRSAVRSLERAGVPRSVAMARVGHKTEAIYKRYAIVDEKMHREAAATLEAWSVDQRTKAQAARGQVKQFAAKGGKG